MESGPDEKHTCTHFPHEQRNKQNGGGKKPQPKAIYKHSNSFLVIKESSCSSTAENLWTFPKKDGGWENRMRNRDFFPSILQWELQSDTLNQIQLVLRQHSRIFEDLTTQTGFHSHAKDKSDLKLCPESVCNRRVLFNFLWGSLYSPCITRSYTDIFNCCSQTLPKKKRKKPKTK